MAARAGEAEHRLRWRRAAARAPCVDAGGAGGEVFRQGGVKPTWLYPPRASGGRCVPAHALGRNGPIRARADARSPHPAFTTCTDCAKYTAKADTLDNA